MSELRKFRFWDVFKQDPDGRLTPLRTVKIGGATFGSSLSFGPGVSLGGVNFFDFMGKDIQAEEQNGMLVIKGFYR